MVSLMTRAFFRLSGQHHNISLRYLSSQTIAPLKYDNVEIQYTTSPKAKPDPSTLVFGKTFSDHMLSVPWNNVTGWQTPKIHPLKPFQMHPAAKVYHYANELFEGMKAYRGKDNVIRLFRPTENMIRMNNSAKRATLPMFDGDELIKLITKLVHIDQEWTPYSTTASLYIRPTIIATEPSLGVTPPNESLLYVLLCPVGAYYPTGMKPVSLLADSRYVRAWPGGSGNTKMGANYAPTTYIQKKEKSTDCQQVLWLYGEDHMLTEVGTMNIFVLWTNEQGEKELITPPLDMGVILPGVTRSSILALAQNWGEFKVSEKIITMKDLMKALDEGRVKEMFGAGTACIVSPVERILYEGKNIHIPTMENKAEIALRFMKELLDIQYGRNSPHEWAVVVNDPSS